jgi:RND family efflux transporter MFP subunit
VGWLWAAFACPVLLALTVLLTRVLPDMLAPVSEAAAVARIDHTPTLNPEVAWQSLRVSEAQKPVPRYGSFIPAHVVADARRSARVGSPLPGRIEAVYVELGQHVQANAALFRVASRELPELRRALAVAEVELAAARSDDARVQSMLRERMVPAKEALASGARLRRAELAQRMAQARLEAMRVSSLGEHSFVVRAPVSGTVIERALSPGQAVLPGDSLLHIADLSRGVFVIAEVFEHDVELLRVGAPAQIELQALGKDPIMIDSHIEMIADVVDPARRTLGVRVHVQDERLRIHQQLRVRFEQHLPEGSVEVGGSAVLFDGMRAFVYVVQDDGAYHRREVELGPWHAGRVAILDGLALGERIVESGGYLLDSRPRELY